MTVEFTEYRRKRKRNNSKHKFPLLRLLFLIGLALFAYFGGWLNRLVDSLPLPGETVVEEPVTWESICTSYAGTPFKLKNKFVQCSWIVNDSVNLPSSFLRYVASLKSSASPKLHWIASKDDFYDVSMVMLEDSTREVFMHMNVEDSAKVWISRKTKCRFPGPCPHAPLGWSALSIAENFDFEGQDALLSADVFHGLGEAPVYPILPGVVLESGKDSLGYFVELNHGGGWSSRVFGLGSWNSAPAVGATLPMDKPVGRLSPHKSASFFLTVRQNGRFVRWNDFFKSTHPVDSARIAIFEKSLDF